MAKNKHKNDNLYLPKLKSYKKTHARTLANMNNAKKKTRLIFGATAVKNLNACNLYSRQIEASRRSVSKFLRKQEKFFIIARPHVPVTRKPEQIRMGKGKGAISHWKINAPISSFIFETTLKNNKAKRILKNCVRRLPTRCIILQRTTK